jgi:Arc/MetJ-type ribon-helix-helix transcriptional regulator
MISGERKGSLMPSVSIHVKVSGALQDHIQRQIGDEGLYENASEYIRALIRRDLHTRDEAWEALQKELAPAMRADDSEFVAVTADDVIRRNMPAYRFHAPADAAQDKFGKTPWSNGAKRKPSPT